MEAPVEGEGNIVKIHLHSQKLLFTIPSCLKKACLISISKALNLPVPLLSTYFSALLCRNCSVDRL